MSQIDPIVLTKEEVEREAGLFAMETFAPSCDINNTECEACQ